jgi:hypothetical protein
VASHPRCVCGAEEGEPHEAPCPLEPCTCGTVKPSHGAECCVAFEPNVGPQTRFIESTVERGALRRRRRRREVAGRRSRSRCAGRDPGLHGDRRPAHDEAARRPAEEGRGSIRDSAALADEESGSTTWIFPRGATVLFTHLQHEKNASDFDGHEFQLEVWDELPHFTEQQYRWLRARIRGTNADAALLARDGEPARRRQSRRALGLPPLRRVARPERGDPRARRNARPARLPPVDPRRCSHFLKDEGSDVERVVPRARRARSRAPSSRRRSPTTRTRRRVRGAAPRPRPGPPRAAHPRRLAHPPGAGAYFRRGWFRFVKERPRADVILRVRRWDLAATEPTAEPGSRLDARRPYVEDEGRADLRRRRRLASAARPAKVRR